MQTNVETRLTLKDISQALHWKKIFILFKFGFFWNVCLSVCLFVFNEGDTVSFYPNIYRHPPVLQFICAGKEQCSIEKEQLAYYKTHIFFPENENASINRNVFIVGFCPCD